MQYLNAVDFGKNASREVRGPAFSASYFERAFTHMRPNLPIGELSRRARFLPVRRLLGECVGRLPVGAQEDWRDVACGMGSRGGATIETGFGGQCRGQHAFAYLSG